MAGLSDRIREHVVRSIIAPARQRAAARVRIRVGDVEREMGLKQRAPTVCRALQKRSFLRDQGLTIQAIEGPPSGLGPRVVLTYGLKAEAPATVKQSWAWFDEMRGMLRGAWDDEGGGEAWLKKERSEFYGPNRPYGYLDTPGQAGAAKSALRQAKNSGLHSLRGLLRGVFDEDGGGEAWLRKERAEFDGPGTKR